MCHITYNHFLPLPVVQHTCGYKVYNALCTDCLDRIHAHPLAVEGEILSMCSAFWLAHMHSFS